MLRSVLVLIAGAAALGACASMSEEECAFTNWEARGIADGEWGEPTGRFQRYTDACARYDIAADFDAWQRGREIGLRSFCTPGGTLEAGLKGRGDMSSCGFDADLNAIHRAATGYYAAEQELGRARSHWDSIINGYDRRSDEVRRLRRKLGRDDLGKDERERAENALDRALDWLDDYPYLQREARYRLDDAERDLDIAQSVLLDVQLEYGLQPSRGRRF